MGSYYWLSSPSSTACHDTVRCASHFAVQAQRGKLAPPLPSCATRGFLCTQAHGNVNVSSTHSMQSSTAPEPGKCAWLGVACGATSEPLATRLTMSLSCATHKLNLFKSQHNIIAAALCSLMGSTPQATDQSTTYLWLARFPKPG